MTLQTALGVVGIVAAIATLIVAIYKLRPESTRIFVDSAKVSVELADAYRTDCLERLAEEKALHAQYRQDVGEHMAEQAAKIRSQKAEIRHLEDRIRLLENGGGSL